MAETWKKPRLVTQCLKLRTKVVGAPKNGEKHLPNRRFGFDSLHWPHKFHFAFSQCWRCWYASRFINLAGSTKKNTMATASWPTKKAHVFVCFLATPSTGRIASPISPRL